MDDEELVDPDQPRKKPSPAESPSWREFDRHSYDFATIIALLQQIACRGDPSKAGVEPWVPVPASERVRRNKIRDRLDQMSERAERALHRRLNRRKGV